MLAAAAVCLLLNVGSMVRRLHLMRRSGLDPSHLGLMDALRLFGWQSFGIWIALVAIFLVLIA